jgi:hypothetical protein
MGVASLNITETVEMKVSSDAIDTLKVRKRGIPGYMLDEKRLYVATITKRNNRQLENDMCPGFDDKQVN